jgi:hypothetical protein
MPDEPDFSLIFMLETASVRGRAPAHGQTPLIQTWSGLPAARQSVAKGVFWGTKNPV